MAAVVTVRQVGRQGLTSAKADDGQRKLPRPIVFWSLNEKTAYRRNRVVQTRMNMIMDDIATQRETSRKSMRYEAHKFRQRNSKYYSHPLMVDENQKGSSVNIAPPNWKPPNDKSTPNGAHGESDVEDSDCNSDCDRTEASPRQRGIITRAKKPAVTFSVYKEVHQIEEDLKIDDFDNADETEDENVCIKKIKNGNIRSLSATQYREIPDLPGQNMRRQHSAFPALRSSMDDFQNSDKEKNNSSHCDSERNRKMNKLAHELKSSDNYFDRSKAAYQLRQDLRKRARMRKQGIKTTVFTLQDALELEKENFFKSKQKVVEYIRRIEDIKRAESYMVNKWTRDSFVQQLNL